MTYIELKQKLENKGGSKNEIIDFAIPNEGEISIYSKSVTNIDDGFICIAKFDGEKYLYLFYTNEVPEKLSMLDELDSFKVDDITVKKCELSTKNRKVLQGILDYLKPDVIGLQDSFGFGDRIGVANAAHIRSLGEHNFKPIFAQQSIRELTRTKRTPDQVMDAAVWAVFQEGYKEGFGADADHLKTTDDIDRMAKAGYTMFTFDPSEYVDNDADDYNENELDAKVKGLDWTSLNDDFESSKGRYLGSKITVGDNIEVPIDETGLKRAYAKYGDAIMHIKRLFDYLKANYSNQPFEVEVSVDETESVTSPFEHYFFAAELNRLKVDFVSLAPRFIGDFEKGIDYKGDLSMFKQEYEKHVAIINHFGNYKISLHSGSDKFSAYKVIGGIENAVTHVKTAGTSYLEALKVVAMKEPDLFRKILTYSASLYENEKKTYHVSADINTVKNADEYSDAELVDLFNVNDVRQILHVAFGRILTDKDESGNYLFKNDIVKCLKKNEDTHYALLIKHFERHLDPFVSK